MIKWERSQQTRYVYRICEFKRISLQLTKRVKQDAVSYSIIVIIHKDKNEDNNPPSHGAAVCG